MKSTKQKEREERKKKKVIALAKLMHMNDLDLGNSQVASKGGDKMAELLNIENSKRTDKGNVVDGGEGHESSSSAICKNVGDANNLTPTVDNSDGSAMDGIEPLDGAGDYLPCVSSEGLGRKTSERKRDYEFVKIASKKNKRLQKRAKMSLMQSDNVNAEMLNIDFVYAKELKRQIEKRRRQLEQTAKLFLRELGVRALLETPQEKRTPIFLTDVQHLLMSTLIGHESPCSPERWCYVQQSKHISHAVVLTLEGVSLFHYLSNESKFSESNKIFENKFEVVMPPFARDNILSTLAQVPLINNRARELINMHGCLEAAIEMNKDPMLLVNTLFPIDPPVVETLPLGLPAGDKFPRTKLLLSAIQMVDEGYPLPLNGALNEHFKNYIFTKQRYTAVTDHSPMFGLDCEMCRTTIGVNELTRISIVNENLETVYETLVMPSNEIVDYLTPYSGITPEILKTATKTLAEVHQQVEALLPSDAILIGQSLYSDLNAMKMMHPYVIDTSVCFNLYSTQRRKSKLRELAAVFLNEHIQQNKTGHDSVEDSRTSMKLVQMKLANNIAFGDGLLMARQQINNIIRLGECNNAPINYMTTNNMNGKNTAIVTAGTLHKRVKVMLSRSGVEADASIVTLHELDGNKKAIRKACETLQDHFLTIVNVRLGDEHFQMDTTDRTIHKIEKWIGKIWKALAHNGMFLVLMNGSADCPSGVMEIAFKKDLNLMATTAVAPMASNMPNTI